MLDQYTQTLQDQIGQLSKLLGGQQQQPEYQLRNAESRYDIVDGLEGARAFQQKMLASTKHIVWDGQEEQIERAAEVRTLQQMFRGA